jgi:Raf kinase inhibitor-like YbhB/YbcL family protein
MDIHQTAHRAKSLTGQLLRPSRAGAEKATSESAREGTIRVSSPAFASGARIPDRHAAEQNVSPALSWSGAPRATREIAIVVEDPDAPTLEPFVHWVIYGIPGATTNLAEGVGRATSLPAGVVQGKNSPGGRDYFGPKPPPGHGVHHYHFQVFALDTALGLGPSADRRTLIEAMDGHVLAQGELVGTYERIAEFSA